MQGPPLRCHVPVAEQPTTLRKARAGPRPVALGAQHLGPRVRGRGPGLVGAGPVGLPPRPGQLGECAIVLATPPQVVRQPQSNLRDVLLDPQLLEVPQRLLVVRRCPRRLPAPVQQVRQGGEAERTAPPVPDGAVVRQRGDQVLLGGAVRQAAVEKGVGVEHPGRAGHPRVGVGEEPVEDLPGGELEALGERLGDRPDQPQQGMRGVASGGRRGRPLQPRLAGDQVVAGGGGQPQLGRAGRRRPGEVGVGDVGQRGPAPQRERVGEPPAADGGILGQPRAACGDLRLEAVQVDVVRADVQPVAAGPGLDGQPGRGAAQPGHQGLERVGLAGRRFAVPNPGHQPAHGDRPAGFQREQDQQPARARAADLDRRTGVGADLQRPEQADLHAVDSARPRPRPGAQTSGRSCSVSRRRSSSSRRRRSSSQRRKSS